MEICFELGKEQDIDELENLYNTLNDHLAENINYPGWLKGIYPIREDAEKGIEEGCLYVARVEGKIAGTIILLDVYEKNIPAIHLYEKCGYERRDSVIFRRTL